MTKRRRAPGAPSRAPAPRGIAGRSRRLRALVAAVLISGAVSLIGLPGIAIEDGGPTADRMLVLRPDPLALVVGEQRALRIFRCDTRTDGAGPRVGRDLRPGTRDDRCRPERRADVTAGSAIDVTQDVEDPSRLSVLGAAAGHTTIEARSPVAAPTSGLVVVTEPVATDDPGAIGTRPRGSGDVDGDGDITAADVDLVVGALAATDPGFIAADDAAFIPAASVLGNGVLSQLDVAVLRDRVEHQQRRERALRRERTDVTPPDVVPLEAGGFGIAAALLDASGLGDIPGTFAVNNVGPDRLYFQGQGSWGIRGDSPGRIVFERPSVMIFTVDEPGFGFAGHQTADSQFADTVTYDAVPRGEGLALPAPSRRLVVPFDIDGDLDVDWRDYVIVAASLGMVADDPGFPARGDADADGMITLDDAALIATVIDILGPGDIGGAARSGDVDGDGDIDAADVRAASTHAAVLRDYEPILPSGPSVSGLLDIGMGITDAAALDVDADDDIDADDVAIIAERAVVDTMELGPFYDLGAPR